MGTAAKDDKNIVIDQDVLADFVDICEKDDLIRIALILNLKIPGFTPRKYKQIPLHLFKQHVLKGITKKIRPESIFTSFVAHFSENFKGLTEQDLFYKIQFDKKISDSQAFAILVLNYHDLYLKCKSIIKQNIKEGKPFYTGIIEESFTDKILAFSNISTNKFKEYLGKVLEEHPMKNSWEDFFKGEGKLKDRLNGTLPAVFDGFYLKLIHDHKAEYSDWTAEEREALLYLGLQDAIFLCSKYQKTLQESNESTNQLKAEIEKLKGDLISLNKKIKEGEVENVKALREIEKLEVKNKRLESEGAVSKEELQRQIQQNTLFKKQINDLHNQLKLSKEQREKPNAEQNAFALFQENIILISLIDDPIFRGCFTNHQFVFLDKPEKLKNYLLKLQGTEKEKVMFLNTDGLNTKSLFKIEKQLKQKNYTYKLVSGGPLKIVRRISFYLEGDIHNEIKEEN